MGPKKSSGRKNKLAPRKSKPLKKETSDEMASLASKGLRGEKLTQAEIKKLAASVLSQDETKGKRGK